MLANDGCDEMRGRRSNLGARCSPGEGGVEFACRGERGRRVGRRGEKVVMVLVMRCQILMFNDTRLWEAYLLQTLPVGFDRMTFDDLTGSHGRDEKRGNSISDMV